MLTSLSNQFIMYDGPKGISKRNPLKCAEYTMNSTDNKNIQTINDCITLKYSVCVWNVELGWLTYFQQDVIWLVLKLANGLSHFLKTRQNVIFDIKRL